VVLVELALVTLLHVQAKVAALAFQETICYVCAGVEVLTCATDLDQHWHFHLAT
jgi:hypothetical protein